MKSFFLLVLTLYLNNMYSKEKEYFNDCKPIKEDFLWLLDHELSNIEYREFINSDNSYKKYLPDTTCWNKKIGKNEPYERYYFRHPAYNNYPVVGISKESAIKYCSWLTSKINKTLINDLDHPVKKVIVRLPNYREWKSAAQGGLSEWNQLPWDGNSLRFEEGKNKGKFRLNFKRSVGDFMGIAGNLNDMADITAPVKSYWPNDYGLYNMCGNVSELVSDKNFAFGGNWFSLGYDVTINSKIKEEISPLIGFRYIIEVVEWKSVKTKKINSLSKKYFKKFKPINDSLFMMDHEVTNEIYNLFTASTGHKRPDSSLWENKFWYSNQYTIKYHWHPDYSNYPVVNISRDDVLSFIEWIEDQYNIIHKQNVQFDLPNEDEWVNASKNHPSKTANYPWGGPYIRNSKGQYLCNFRVYPELFTKYDSEGNISYKIPDNNDPMLGADLDGYPIIAPIKSYFSNTNGLYDMSGNVSEMIKNSDFTKGGSWDSEMKYVQINSKEYQAGPDPEIGFRLIMIKSSE